MFAVCVNPVFFSSLYSFWSLNWYYRIYTYNWAHQFHCTYGTRFNIQSKIFKSNSQLLILSNLILFFSLFLSLSIHGFHIVYLGSGLFAKSLNATNTCVYRITSTVVSQNFHTEFDMCAWKHFKPDHNRQYEQLITATKFPDRNCFIGFNSIIIRKYSWNVLLFSWVSHNRNIQVNSVNHCIKCSWLV